MSCIVSGKYVLNQVIDDDEFTKMSFLDYLTISFGKEKVHISSFLIFFSVHNHFKHVV